ncbi:MAG: hypothetical protein B9S38_01610 [Verrucomicrobiia bacterium Tous-C4TDCM]|nr:MAG: hypothetical protein B9S38_01610 [Verrucomicrobiae bacterium Tous-C4TDCM]
MRGIQSCSSEGASCRQGTAIKGPGAWVTACRPKPKLPVPSKRSSLRKDRGEIEIDNNLIENGIRPTAVGKKNWLFMGSETTGQRAAIIFTMVECAKRQGHDPEVWLADVLDRLPAMTNRDDLSVLLPCRWQPAAAPAARTAEACPA